LRSHASLSAAAQFPGGADVVDVGGAAVRGGDRFLRVQSRGEPQAPLGFDSLVTAGVIIAHCDRDLDTAAPRRAAGPLECLPLAAECGSDAFS
jgi:hypothetical protein